MSFKLAELFVQIGANLKPLHDDMAKAKASLAALAATPITLPMVALTAAAGAAAVAVYKCTDAASDLNEALNKAGVAFGDSVQEVSGYVDQMAQKFGAPKTELLSAASSFGMMARGAGQGEDAAAKFATEMSQCAIDARSINNVGLPAALEKIRAGLSGEAEPLRAMSVFLTENAVKAEAARLGLAAYNAELSEGQKIAARASLIKQGLTYAKGDREKTAGGFSNQSEEMKGRLTNLAASIGQAFLPAAEKMAAGINGALKSLEAAFAGVEAHAASFSSHFDAVVENARAAWEQFATGVAIMAGHINGDVDTVNGGFVALGKAAQWLKDSFASIVEAIRVTWRNLGLIVEQTAIRVMGAWTNMVETLSWVSSVVGTFLDWFATNWRTVFEDAFSATMTALQNLAKSFMDFGKAAYDWIASGFSKPFEFRMTPIMEGFNAKTPAMEMPKLVLSSVDDAIRENMEKMVAAEQAFQDAGTKPGADKLKATEQAKAAFAAAEGAGGKAKASAKAEFVGIQDFAKNIQKGAFDKDKTGRDQINELRRANELLAGIERNSGKPHLAVAGGKRQ